MGEDGVQVIDGVVFSYSRSAYVSMAPGRSVYQSRVRVELQAWDPARPALSRARQFRRSSRQKRGFPKNWEQKVASSCVYWLQCCNIAKIGEWEDVHAAALWPLLCILTNPRPGPHSYMVRAPLYHTI
jgi:hypothetical protein